MERSEKIKMISAQRRDQFDDDLKNPQQLPLIADEIRLKVGSIKRNIYDIGKLLTKAKKITDHGKFKEWIKENFEFSYQTANNFMNVYAHCIKRPQLVQTIPQTVLYTICSKKFPGDLREVLFKNGDYLQRIRDEEIKEIMERFKQGEINLDSPEIKRLTEFDRRTKQYADYRGALLRNIELLKGLRDDVEKRAGEIHWPVMKNAKETELTEKQEREMEELIKEVRATVKGIFPKHKVVKKLKPKME